MEYVQATTQTHVHAMYTVPLASNLTGNVFTNEYRMDIKRIWNRYGAYTRM